MEVRKDNPASLMLVGQAWPEDEPTPVFLSEADDNRLQGVCVAPADAPFKQLRSVAIVALFLGTGIGVCASMVNRRNSARYWHARYERQ